MEIRVTDHPSNPPSQESVIAAGFAIGPWGDSVVESTPTTRAELLENVARAFDSALAAQEARHKAGDMIASLLERIEALEDQLRNLEGSSDFHT